MGLSVYARRVLTWKKTKHLFEVAPEEPGVNKSPVAFHPDVGRVVISLSLPSAEGFFRQTLWSVTYDVTRIKSDILKALLAVYVNLMLFFHLNGYVYVRSMRPPDLLGQSAESYK